jgi:hypothetical protein
VVAAADTAVVAGVGAGADHAAGKR